MATKNVGMCVSECVTGVADKRLDRLYKVFWHRTQVFWHKILSNFLFTEKTALNGFPMAAILNI